MKKRLLIATLCLSAILPVLSQGRFFPVRDRMLTTSLNGTWSFKLSNGAEWKNILVPGNWETQGFKMPEYGGNIQDLTGEYLTTFAYNPAWEGQHVILRFDGVHFGYTVYLNDKEVGSWGSAFNMCQFDITPYLNKTVNTLRVVVSTRSDGWQFDTNDCWAIAGITRDVELFAVNNIYLEDVTFSAAVDQALNATIQCQVDLGRFAADTGKYHLNVSLTDMLNHHPANFTAVISADTKAYHFTGQLLQPHLWSAETPYLYRLNVNITDERGKVIQQINERVGIRSVQVEGMDLKVNHQKVHLRGACLNEIDPKVGRALTYTDYHRILKTMKQANINFIRTVHYPLSPYFLQLCDEMGFYVADEVPFGFGDKWLSDKAYLPELIRRAEATLYRDKNHPAVIIWTIGNENPYNTEVVEEVVRYVKQTDPTRPRGLPMIGSYFMRMKDQMSPNVDIYMPHYLSVGNLQEALKIITKPLLLTEYAHALGLASDELETQNAFFLREPRVIGGSVWCWTDQSLLSLKPIFKGDPAVERGVWIDEHRYMDNFGNQGGDGVVYADGYPQEDFFLLRKLYSPVVIREDSLMSTTTGQVSVTIENRYDFLSLSGYTLRYMVRQYDKPLGASGCVALSAKAGAQESIPVSCHIPADKVAGLTLYLEVLTHNGTPVYERNLPIGRAGQTTNYAQLISAVPDNKAIVCTVSKKGVVSIADRQTKQTLVESPLLLRVGRPMTISLEAQSSRSGQYSWLPYMLTPVVEQYQTSRMGDETLIRIVCRWNRIDKPEEYISGNVDIHITRNGVVRMDYDLTASDNATGSLLECGLTLKANPAYDAFRWWGKGPFTTTPGKSKYNETGLWALQRNDLRFIGNKQVQLGLLTTAVPDSRLQPIAVSSSNGNIAVENIDGQIYLSQNVVVAGYGTKFALPKQLMAAKNLKQAKGSLTLCVHDFREIFPPQTVVAEQPYLKSYGW